MSMFDVDNEFKWGTEFEFRVSWQRLPSGKKSSIKNWNGSKKKIQEEMMKKKKKQVNEKSVLNYKGDHIQ